MKGNHISDNTDNTMYNKLHIREKVPYASRMPKALGQGRQPESDKKEAGYSPDAAILKKNHYYGAPIKNHL